MFETSQKLSKCDTETQGEQCCREKSAKRLDTGLPQTFNLWGKKRKNTQYF